MICTQHRQYSRFVPIGHGLDKTAAREIPWRDAASGFVASFLLTLTMGGSYVTDPGSVALRTAQQATKGPHWHSQVACDLQPDSEPRSRASHSPPNLRSLPLTEEGPGREFACQARRGHSAAAARSGNRAALGTAEPRDAGPLR